jgi:hypothetical protein
MGKGMPMALRVGAKRHRLTLPQPRAEVGVQLLVAADAGDVDVGARVERQLGDGRVPDVIGGQDCRPSSWQALAAPIGS